MVWLLGLLPILCASVLASRTDNSANSIILNEGTIMVNTSTSGLTEAEGKTYVPGPGYFQETVIGKKPSSSGRQLPGLGSDIVVVSESKQTRGNEQNIVNSRVQTVTRQPNKPKKELFHGGNKPNFPRKDTFYGRNKHENYPFNGRYTPIYPRKDLFHGRNEPNNPNNDLYYGGNQPNYPRKDLFNGRNKPNNPRNDLFDGIIRPNKPKNDIFQGIEVPRNIYEALEHDIIDHDHHD
ncbi:uncharacterized protein LOC120321447 [Drosophila yakuba]|uniref:uncharacterized protein LOC120321447 n=1 Tax=Drosophila yakuba TaxID=7245 RepID=UPI0019308ADE|nr:uncharacterized protein LOC120321447 [Drosophila yakuba]